MTLCIAITPKWNREDLGRQIRGHVRLACFCKVPDNRDRYLSASFSVVIMIAYGRGHTIRSSRIDVV